MKAVWSSLVPVFVVAFLHIINRHIPSIVYWPCIFYSSLISSFILVCGTPSNLHILQFLIIASISTPSSFVSFLFPHFLIVYAFYCDSVYYQRFLAVWLDCEYSGSKYLQFKTFTVLELFLRIFNVHIPRYSLFSKFPNFFFYIRRCVCESNSLRHLYLLERPPGANHRFAARLLDIS